MIRCECKICHKVFKCNADKVCSNALKFAKDSKRVLKCWCGECAEKELSGYNSSSVTRREKKHNKCYGDNKVKVIYT